MRVSSWFFMKVGEPFEWAEHELMASPGEVLVQVAACGICHTDLGFYYDAVPTRHPLPLVLGHEISGVVVECGEGAEAWQGQRVIVPAVIPCGECAACDAGKSSICPRQIFPGCDVHGGFGTHVVVPAKGLCRVPDSVTHKQLEQLSVIADAVTTPYQALEKASLKSGDLAIFVGVGGVGGFGVQLAAARGARVIAIDRDPERLAALSSHGASACLDASELDTKAIDKAVRAFAKEHEIASWNWKIFETSGSPQGQQLAFRLLKHGAHLGVVGYTPKSVDIRLSNLMAFDATASGNWGCPPEHYPACMDSALEGDLALEPFIERRPLNQLQATFEDLRAHRVRKRIVLIPENHGKKDRDDNGS